MINDSRNASWSPGVRILRQAEVRVRLEQLLEEVDEALALGHNVKPVLLGPSAARGER